MCEAMKSFQFVFWLRLGGRCQAVTAKKVAYRLSRNNVTEVGQCALALVTAGLALYRKFQSNKEDDLIHIAAGEEKLIPNQIALAHQMDVIDRWGKALTVVTAVLGLALAAGYLYRGWIETSH